MTKVRSTGGFWLLMGALLMAASLRLLFWFALACAVHELGHWAVLRLLGGRLDTFRLTAAGAVMVPRRPRLFTYWEECLMALAGPLASIFLAIAAAAWGRRSGSGDAFLLAGLSLALGVFNLLPAGPLDGGRITRALLSWLAGPHRAEPLCQGASALAAAGLCGLGLWVLLRGGSFTLLLCGLWLLWGQAGLPLPRSPDQRAEDVSSSLPRS